MAKAQSRLEKFLQSDKWAHEYGRRSLPVLVARVERYRGQPDTDIPEFTYGDLAGIVAGRSYAHPIQHALGSIGFGLKELAEAPGWKFGRIPPIQLLVWSQGQYSPGEIAFGFLGFSARTIREMTKQDRQSAARVARSDILAYPYWREVLAHLALKPVTLDLPDAKNILASPSPDRFGGIESLEHKRLKSYLATHYSELGIKGNFKATFEQPLFSGDKADLMLDEIRGKRRYCIEVKSRISPDGDLIRGIFQCVKYKAVVLAQERFNGAKSVDYTPKDVNVLLATERSLSGDLKQLSELLNVCAVPRVEVPKGYQPRVQRET